MAGFLREVNSLQTTSRRARHQSRSARTWETSRGAKPPSLAARGKADASNQPERRTRRRLFNCHQFRISCQIDEFLAIAPPSGARTPGLGDLPLASAAGKWCYVNFGLRRIRLMLYAIQRPSGENWPCPTLKLPCSKAIRLALSEARQNPQLRRVCPRTGRVVGDKASVGRPRGRVLADLRFQDEFFAARAVRPVFREVGRAPVRFESNTTLLAVRRPNRESASAGPKVSRVCFSRNRS